MSLFKRLSATFGHQLSEAVSQIENQDAVVAAIIKESRESLAKARVRLSRVVADAEQSARQLADLEQKQARWLVRAKEAQQIGDEAKALACLKEKKLCTAEFTRLQQRHSEHCAARIRIESDVRTAEEKLQALQHKQHMLRTRESAASTLAGLQKLESEHSEDLAATFERWEMKITGQELSIGGVTHNTVGELEQAYLSLEEEASLREELALLASDSASADQALKTEEGK